MEEQESRASETEAPVVPTPQDLAEVNSLSGVVARLEQELELARLRLRDAWARVPFDPIVLKKPWRSDIKATCRVCGNPTTWRTARGLAEHFPACPIKPKQHKGGIPDEVWNLMLGLTGSENDESLDDD